MLVLGVVFTALLLMALPTVGVTTTSISSIRLNQTSKSSSSRHLMAAQGKPQRSDGSGDKFSPLQPPPAQLSSAGELLRRSPDALLSFWNLLRLLAARSLASCCRLARSLLQEVPGTRKGSVS